MLTHKQKQRVSMAPGDVMSNGKAFRGRTYALLPYCVMVTRGSVQPSQYMLASASQAAVSAG